MIDLREACSNVDPIPDSFARGILELWGTKGAEWLDWLPAILVECERRWSLTVMRPFSSLSYSYVAPAVMADGSDVVLKVGVPNPELRTEIEALRIYDGCGAARMLDAEADQGALLLERLRPGAPLSSLADDEEATSIAARVMRRLWRPVPPEHAFPTVERWTRGLERLRARFGGTSGPLPADLVDQAEGLFDELIGSMAEPVLLHGDLHHGNILAAERQPWLALDPKGVIGEPAYEVGPLLLNPMPHLLTWSQPGRILARRVDQLAQELGFDRARVRGWGLARAVLSARWSIEDHGRGWEYSIACAELLAAVRA